MDSLDHLKHIALQSKRILRLAECAVVSKEYLQNEIDHLKDLIREYEVNHSTLG